MFRKSTIFLLVMILSLAMTVPALAAPLSAATTVAGGNVSGTWDAAGSPYLVEGNITVPTGATLTIEPGVEVLFQSWYSLTVNGTLVADGAQGAPILFGGGHPTAGWPGIRFVNAPDGSRLTYTIIENGRATGADPLNKGGGIYVDNSSPLISHSIIRNNHAKYSGGGIYLNASNAAHDLGGNETAFSFRDANWVQMIIGADPDPVNNEKIISWTQDYWLALHPHSAGGAYVNFLMDEGENRIKDTYRDNYDRLVLAKNKYDPTNFFRLNQNIKPSV